MSKSRQQSPSFLSMSILFSFFSYVIGIEITLPGTLAAESLGTEENLSRSVKGEEKDREHKRDVEAAKEKERSKDKYMGKSIQELDLSDCERCTPSYRLLPPDVIRFSEFYIAYSDILIVLILDLIYSIQSRLCATDRNQELLC